MDEVIEIEKRNGPGRKNSLARLMGEEWDIVFVPHESVRTALWMWRVRARRAKVAFRKWWNVGVFTHRVVKPMDFPDALRQLSLLTPFDSALAEKFASDEVSPLSNPLSQKSPWDFREQPIPDWASMFVPPRERSPKIKTKRVFLAPGSVWNTKRWTLRGYEALAHLLLQRGYEVELVGSAQEKQICAAIAEKVPGVKNRAGETSLAGLVKLFRDGTALVCNDSGAMHAAAVAGLPTVAIFGPTVLAQGFRPWQSNALVVQRELGCRPCGKHGAVQCPIGTHECMEKITASDVLNALFVLLGEASTQV